MHPTDHPQNQGIVMIVDDVPDNLALLSGALDQAGYMVLVALDGLSALDRMQRQKPDTVLLDAMKPGLDGVDPCRRINAQAELDADPMLRSEARSAGKKGVRTY